MDIQERAQEKSLHNKKLAVKVVPNVGEKVWSIVPPFRISCLMPDSDNGGSGVISRPTQFFTARTIWKPENEAKYIEVFKKLEKEEKIFCVGKINLKLQVSLSDAGHEHLKKMDRKYQWI